MSEQHTAQANHRADRRPSDDEAALADKVAAELKESGELASVATHHKEMDRLGAEAKGEGQID